MSLAPDTVHSLLIGGILLIAVVVFTLLAVQIARSGTACMTRSEASVTYPGKWLYWHTKHRCWDATPSRPGRPVRRIAHVRPRPAVPAAPVQIIPSASVFVPWDVRIPF